MKVLQEPGHFREHVLAQEHKLGIELTSRQKGCQADDRRICEADDHVWARDAQPSEARREKIAEVIDSPARKPPGPEGRTCSPENLHAVARFPLDWHPSLREPAIRPPFQERWPRHH